MADFFFFTDVDLLNSQTADQAYGPAGTDSGKDRFRVTSLHSATGTPKAYAICDGQIAVQQDSSNADLIHLILKPSKQPDFNISTISYIIYKGIKKNSLINESNEIIKNQNNNLSETIYKSWEDYCKATKISFSNPTVEVVGINLKNSIPNYSDDDFIDNLFYKESSDIQFPKVTAGWTLGQFDSNLFGIEIIIESVGYEPKLKLARNLQNYILVDQYTGSDDRLLFEHWHKKEEILNFYDPTAFYGSFYVSKLKYIKTDLSNEKIKTDEIYTKILKGTHHDIDENGNFYNRNKVYLDIRNEHNQSFNYYKNYGTHLLLSLNEGDETEINYYSNNWPICILNSSPDTVFPLNNDSKNMISVKLPVGDNFSGLIYVSQGYLNNKSTFKKELKNKNKFIEIFTEDNFTNSFTIFTPIINENKIVSSYIKLRYLKRRIQDENQSNSLFQIVSTDFADLIFTPYLLKIPYSSSASNGLKIKIYNEELYIDYLEERGTDFVANIGVAEDSEGISFFAYAKDVRETNSLFSKRVSISLSSEIDKTSTNLFSSFLDKFSNLIVEENFIQVNSLNNEPIQLFQIKESSLFNGFTTPNFSNEFISISFSKDEFDQIKSIVNEQSGFLPNYKIFMGYSERTSLNEDLLDDYSDDVNPIFYDSASILFKGFKIENSILQISEFTPLLNSKPFKLIF